MDTWRVRVAALLFLVTWPLFWWGPPWIALWPSVLALAIVFFTQRVIAGLLSGAAAGAVILSNGNPLTAFIAFFEDHLVPSVQSDWRVSVLVFTLLLGGFAALLEHGGGLQSLLQRWVGTARGAARRVQAGVVGFGLVCFFDGLANSMLVGRSMRPMADRAGVSREKLAYLVDSTSSSVACVAIVSTWIAYQLTMIQEGFAAVDREVQPYALFLQSLPYNFYCWFTLLLVAVVVWRGWNPGPMRRAEAAARPEEELPDSAVRASPARALVPLAVLIGGILVGLYLSGAGAVVPESFRALSAAYGEADAATVLVAASALACLVAFGLNGSESGGRRGSEVFMEGVTALFVPVLILISAWVLSSTLRELDAAGTLLALVGERIPAPVFPAAVFVAGMAISFTTGTSWGTMGVLTPLVLPVALALGDAGNAAAVPLVAATVAAVFGGAVFGDHCSPLSDTTIVSSISCGIEPMDHVKTQLPYALLAAGISLVAGYGLLALGLSVWLALFVGAGFVIAAPIGHRRLAGDSRR